MAAILIRTPRRLMGYGDCGATPCGASTDLDDPNAWSVANACGPGTIPYEINDRVVCLSADGTSSYPKLPFVDINGWRMAQSPDGAAITGAGSHVCGPGTGEVQVGTNTGCTPGGGPLALTADGRVVLASLGATPSQVFMPGISPNVPVILDAKMAPMDVAQSVMDMANSPEAAAVTASVQDQVQRNPIPFIASLAGGWYKGFWGAMIAGAVAYYLTKPKVQIAVDAAGASLVVDAQTAAQAVQIAANSGTSVNVAGYFAGW